MFHAQSTITVISEREREREREREEEDDEKLKRTVEWTSNVEINTKEEIPGSGQSIQGYILTSRPGHKGRIIIAERLRVGSGFSHSVDPD